MSQELLKELGIEHVNAEKAVLEIVEGMAVASLHPEAYLAWEKVKKELYSIRKIERAS